MTTAAGDGVQAVDRCIGGLLAAGNEAAAILALRKLFVEELDFEQRAGSVALHAEGLPASATRVAERDGVQVVAVRLATHGRLLVRDIREALKQVRETLKGEMLLAAGDAVGGEWQLVYPSFRGDKEILRRIVLQREQPRRTVVEQLAKVYGRARRGDLRAALESAYDVEAVTKDFFREYKRVFDNAMSLITGLPDDDRRLFCQTLFNRLMFIYFLQRKGWLTFNGNADYLHSLWKDSIGQGENFYKERLRMLFFVSLSSPRSTGYSVARKLAEEKTGKVPFLNGGLFSEERLDRVLNVTVPNEAIEPLLNDLFRRFNFTISESTPYDVQVAVDPEMLGKVFEELVTGRHETGSYYTPRPVVSFMCREALKGYLQTRVPDLREEAAAKYVDRDDVSGITREQAGRILDAIEQITVVDPACGSGAYLLGMMQELLECETALYNPKLLSGPRSLYDMKLRIIERNVYGVDIDQFAVNIAMLRLWLSLIVEYEGDDPPPLPNLDFKIVCKDSLAGPSPAAPAPTLADDALWRRAIEVAALKLEFATAVGEEKNQLRWQIRELQREMTELVEHGDVPAGSIDWRVDFAEVFQRGGFDAVLANPPYVRHELIRELKPRLKEVYGALYSGTADLYVYFYYRALQLLRDGGMLVFISSNKWFRAAYGAKLRELTADGSAIWSITDFGDLPVFESATAYPMIFVAQRAGPPRATRLTDVPSLAAPYPDVDAVIRQYGFDLPPAAISGADWRLTGTEMIGRLDRMRVGTVPLGEFVGGRIYYGVKTGFNKAFVIDRATRDDLVAADPKSAEIIKPFIVGKDVRRWAVDYEDRWLIFTRRGVDIDAYPAVRDHLARWREELTPKEFGAPRDGPGRKPGRYKWYEIQDDVAYYRAFEGPKILFPDIAKEPRFALDRTGSYSTNTTYLIPSDDLLLLGLLNSHPVADFFIGLGALIRGGYLRFFDQYVGQIPVPDAAPPDRAAVEHLVERCLNARGQGTEVAEWESEIDARVARLYGLETAPAIGATPDLTVASR